MIPELPNEIIQSIEEERDRYLNHQLDLPDAKRVHYNRLIHQMAGKILGDLSLMMQNGSTTSELYSSAFQLKDKIRSASETFYSDLTTYKSAHSDSVKTLDTLSQSIQSASLPPLGEFSASPVDDKIEEKKTQFATCIKLAGFDHPLAEFKCLEDAVSGLNKKQREEIVTFVPDAQLGRAIDTVSAPFALISKVGKAALSGIYTIGASQGCMDMHPHNYEACMTKMTGSDPEFNQALYKSLPNAIKTVVHFDQEISRLDQSLHKKYRTTPGLVHEGAEGFIDVASGFVIKGAISSMKKVLPIRKGVIQSTRIPQPNRFVELTRIRSDYLREVDRIKREVLGRTSIRKVRKWPMKRQEQVARTLHSGRREIGLKYKLKTDPDFLNSKIARRNMERYNDPLGPAIEHLRNQGKSWSQIIETAVKPGGYEYNWIFVTANFQ